MSDRPQNPDVQSLIDPDDEFGSPPEPEQIWPPPEPTPVRRKAPAPPLLSPETSFANDPELAWIDETDEISRAIDEIRHLDDTGEAEQVQTEGEDELATDIDVEVDETTEAPTASDAVVTAPAPDAATSLAPVIVAGSTPVIFRQTTGPMPRSQIGKPADSKVASTVGIEPDARAEVTRLWNNVFAGGTDAPRTVMVTAVRQGDGATQVAAALAMAGLESASELRVALIDLQWHNPMVAETMGVAATPGVAEMLEGTATLEQVLRTVTLANGQTLQVISAGKPPAQPLAVLRSRQMKSFLSMLKERFDHAIIDVASADENADAQIIGPMVDGALLVVGHSPRDAAIEAKRRLDQAHVRTLGAVLNRRSGRAFETRAGAM